MIGGGVGAALGFIAAAWSGAAIGAGLGAGCLLLIGLAHWVIPLHRDRWNRLFRSLTGEFIVVTAVSELRDGRAWELAPLAARYRDDEAAVADARAMIEQGGCPVGDYRVHPRRDWWVLYGVRLAEPTAGDDPLLLIEIDDPHELAARPRIIAIHRRSSGGSDIEGAFHHLATDLHCVSCGYLLRGVPSPRCPECGQTIEPEPW